MTGPRGRIASRALALAVLAIAAAAAGAAIRDGPSETGDAGGRVEADPHAELAAAGAGLLPAPGALPGRLVVLEEGTCRPRVLDLALLEVGPPGPQTGCRAWFEPSGRYGAVSLPDRDGMWLLDVEAGSIGRQVSASAEPVAFADDGGALAQCGADGRTLVVELPGGAGRLVDGCRPAFAPDGAVLTRPAVRLPTSLLRDGRELLGYAELARGLPAYPAGAMAVIGYDGGADGLLAVLVAMFPGRDQDEAYAPDVRPRLTLELWRDGLVERVLPVGGVTSGFGSRVELSPSGSHALVTSSGHGLLVVLDLRRPGAPDLRQRQFGVSWSPDGAWLAVATDDRIEIRTGATLELAYELPLAVRALAWARPA